MDHYEQILDEKYMRFTVFPLDERYSDLWILYKKHQKSIWSAEEVQGDLSIDVKQFKNLHFNEQKYITDILIFFNISDSLVMKNLANNFGPEVQILEASMFYGLQMFMEQVHAETYGLLVETFIQDKDELKMAQNAITEHPYIKRKADWCFKWMNSEKRFAERLVAFAAVEGIFFSGSFCAIFWFKNRGILPGLTMSNELISRDEGFHCEFACALYNHLTHRLDESVVHEIIWEAVTLEQEFITNALPCDLIGMNSVKMSTYIKYVADYLLKMLGYKPLYKVDNPFPWMTMISMMGKQNIFEGRSSFYSNRSIMSEDTNDQLRFDGDF